jgi:uncharacterized protein (TIGR02145 family)
MKNLLKINAKKLCLLALIMATVFCFAGCPSDGGGGDDDNNDGNNNNGGDNNNGNNNKGNDEPAHVHDWGEWAQTTAPNCTEPGIKTRDCTVCGVTNPVTQEGDPVDPTAHVWGDYVQTTLPSCTAKGIKTRVCIHHAEQTDTETQEGDPIDSAAHDYQWQVTTTASVTASKIETEICSHTSSHTGGMRMTDGRDNKIYKIVKIGTQTWFAENFNYNAAGSVYYNNSQTTNEKYGKLYNWDTATAANFAPPGWHLPSSAEWDTLMNSVGGASMAGKRLKSTDGWNNNGNGEDTYGFAALPGGFGTAVGVFNLVGDGGYWRSSSETAANEATISLMNTSDSANSNSTAKISLYSVRFVQD